MRSIRERERPEDDAWSFRIGGAAIGLLGGGVLGFVLSAVVAVVFRGASYFAPFVFGGAAAGAIAGYLRGSLGFFLAEGAVHFITGFFVGLAERVVNPLPEAPPWLKALYWLGLLLGLAFVLRFWW